MEPPQDSTPPDIAEIADFAKGWIRREMARAGLAGSLSPRVVNPRAQGWLAGFVEALGRSYGLDAAKQYELEARLYVSVFEGTPMGEQLGLEALMMAKQMHSMPGARGMLADWERLRAKGMEGGEHFAGLLRAFASFGEALR